MGEDEQTQQRVELLVQQEEGTDVTDDIRPCFPAEVRQVVSRLAQRSFLACCISAAAAVSVCAFALLSRS
jgi:hypothetical protein